MLDQDRPDAKSDQPDGQPFADPPVVEPVAPLPIHEEGERHPQGNGVSTDKDTTCELKEIKSGERWLIGVGIASVVVNLIIAGVYYGQLTQMRKATDAATSAAKTAREALVDSKESGKNILEQIQKQSRSMEESAKANRVVAEAFEAALQDTKTNFEMSMRPYVYVQQVKLVNPLKVNEEALIELKINNSGKTPAVLRSWKAVVAYLPFGDTQDCSKIARSGPRTGVPDANVGAEAHLYFVSGGPDLLSKSRLDAIEAGQVRIVIYSSFSVYSPVFKKTYEPISLSAFYDPKSSNTYLNFCY